MQDNSTEQTFSIKNIAAKGLDPVDKKQVLADIGPEQIAKGSEPIPGEKEKTMDDLVLISLAKEGMNAVRQKRGLEPFQVSLKNIHLLPGVGDQKIEPGTVKGGGSDPETQSIIAREGRSKTESLDILTHELLHLSSYGAMQITTEGEDDLGYRGGFNVVSRDGRRQHFHLVDEALNELLAKEAVESLKENPWLIAETKETQQILDSQKVENPEDVLSAHFRDSGSEVEILRYKYPEERQALDMLIEKITQRNPQQFQDKQEVYDLFMKGKLRGNLLEIGRVVDKTFGKGTFRKIGEVSNTVHVTEQYKKFIDAL